MNKETIKVVNIGKPDIEAMSGSEHKVVNVGKPDIEAMSGNERNTFFATLLSRISSLSKQQRTEVSVQRR